MLVCSYVAIVYWPLVGREAVIGMRKKGFTLIELLVVIAIIGMLLAIIAPSLKKAKKVARRIVCMSNVRSFSQAFNVYAAEHDDKVIQLYFQNQGKFWTEKLQEYYEADKLRLCPEAVIPMEGATSSHGNLGQSRTGNPYRAWYHIRDTGDNAGEMFAGSYGTNGWAHEAVSNPELQTWGFDPRDHYGKMSEGNSQVPLMLDCTWVAGYPLDDDAPLTVEQYYNYWTTAYGFGQMSRYCFDRHSHQINVSFMDGSAESVRVEDLWKLKWHRSFKPRHDITIEW